MTVYAPGTQERDPQKQNMALQAHAGAIETATTNIATNTSDIATNAANIATNTANIATNSAAITSLQTAGPGLINSGGSLAVSLSKLTASLGADVLLNNTANYFDGPSVAQGTSGTWLASGTVTLIDTSVNAGMFVKLWDGTTVMASAGASTLAASNTITISVSGFITSPAGNIRISVRDASSTSGKIFFNVTGNSKDSTITAIRIA